MKIICSSCKKIVDTEKHDFCPKCGANFNYSDNLKSGARTEDYDEYERIRQENNIRMAEAQAEQARNAHESAEQARKNAAQARRAAMHTETKRRHTANNHRHEGKKNTGCGCLATIGMLIIFFSAIASEIRENGGDFFEAVSDELQSYIESETEDFYSNSDDYYMDGYIQIGVSEWIYDIDYGFCCDKVIPAADIRSAEGYMNVSFRLNIENCRDDREEYYYSSIVKCYADGEACEEQINPDYEFDMFMPGFLSRNQVHTGYVTFSIPVDAETISLVYENTEVVIENVYMYAEEWKAAVLSKEEEERAFYEEISSGEYTELEFGEYGTTDEGFIFCCNDIKEPEVAFVPPAEGYMYVSFGFEIINDTNGYQYYFSYPQCYADGEQGSVSAFSGDTLFIPGELEPAEEYSGYMCYEVPIDTEVFEIIYQDCVRVTIPSPFKGE